MKDTIYRPERLWPQGLLKWTQAAGWRELIRWERPQPFPGASEEPTGHTRKEPLYGTVTRRRGRGAQGARVLSSRVLRTLLGSPALCGPEVPLQGTRGSLALPTDLWPHRPAVTGRPPHRGWQLKALSPLPCLLLLLFWMFSFTALNQ